MNLKKETTYTMSLSYQELMSLVEIACSVPEENDLDNDCEILINEIRKFVKINDK